MRIPFEIRDKSDGSLALASRFNRIVDRRVIELLVDVATALRARRGQRSSTDAREERCSAPHEDVALFQIILYMEGEASNDLVDRVWRRLTDTACSTDIQCPDAMAKTRRFDGDLGDCDVCGMSLLRTLHDTFLLTIEPVRDQCEALDVEMLGVKVRRGQVEWGETKRGRRSDVTTVAMACCCDTGLVVAFDADESKARGARAIGLVKAALDQGLRPLAEYGRRRVAGVGRPWKKRHSVEGVAARLKCVGLTESDRARRLIELYCKLVIHNIGCLARLENKRAKRIDFEPADRASDRV